MRKDGGSRKSRARLLAAVTDLLDSSADIERVTVTDVVSAAGLTRPTFYAVFEDLPSAFAASALARLDDAFSGLGVDPDVDTTSRPEQMYSAFFAIMSRLNEHAEFFTRVLRGPGGPVVYERIVEFVAARVRDSSPVSRALSAGKLPVEMSSSAIAAGVVWTMTSWMGEEPRRPLAEVAIELRSFVEASVFGGLGGPTDTPSVRKAILELNGVTS